jgi:hypothetical protein
MRFDFELKLGVSSSPSQSHKGELAMGDWARMMFQKLADREGRDHQRIQKEVLDRQQTLASAPELWEALSDMILEEVKELNEMRPGLVKIKDQVHGDQPSLSVSIVSAPKVVRILNLTFERDIPKISYSVLQPQGPNSQPLKITDSEFTFRVFREAVWLYGRDEETTVEDAVKLLLGYLVT